MLTAPAPAAERLRTRPSIGLHARPSSPLAAVAAAAHAPAAAAPPPVPPLPNATFPGRG